MRVLIHCFEFELIERCLRLIAAVNYLHRIAMSGCGRNSVVSASVDGASGWVMRSVVVTLFGNWLCAVSSSSSSAEEPSDRNGEKSESEQDPSECSGGFEL